MASWRDMTDASGDGRGRKNVILPRLQLIAAVGDDGQEGTFGPYKSKASAANSMKAAQETAETNGLDTLVFHGPLEDSGRFWFGVE